MSPVERLNHAFTVAKDQLAIERLLDAEGTANSELFLNTCTPTVFIWTRITVESFYETIKKMVTKEKAPINYLL